MDEVNYSNNVPSKVRRQTRYNRSRLKRNHSVNKLILKTKHTNNKKPYHLQDRSSKYGSNLFDLLRLFCMFLVFYLFFQYHKRFKENMEQSVPYKLMKNLEFKRDVEGQTKSLNLTDPTTRKYISSLIDDDHFLLVPEVNSTESESSAIARWRDPNDDFMYSRYLRIIERKVGLDENEQLEYKSQVMHKSCQETSSNLEKFHNCSASVFIIYKRIRQLIFEIKKANDCTRPCSRPRLRDAELNTTISSKTKTKLSPFYRNNLFPNEMCYCRNGQTQIHHSFEDYRHKCSKLSEDCDSHNCNKGFTFNSRCYRKNGTTTCTKKKDWTPCRKTPKLKKMVRIGTLEEGNKKCNKDLSTIYLIGPPKTGKTTIANFLLKNRVNEFLLKNSTKKLINEYINYSDHFKSYTEHEVFFKQITKERKNVQIRDTAGYDDTRDF